MRGRARFNPTRYRRERLRELERQVEFLAGERDRLELLLGSALRIAAGRDCDAGELLDVIAEMHGLELTRAHYVDVRRTEAA